MADVRVLVVRAAGINCDEEVMHCWEKAGAVAELIHLNRLVGEPEVLRDYQIVTLPGGFSYGDDLGGGAIFAQRIVTELSEPFATFVQRGGGLLGICNGFQILVKAGLLPGGRWGRDTVTVTYNDSAKFEARWVTLAVCADNCPFLTPGQQLEMPVEHAEGKVVVSSPERLSELQREGRIAVRYVDRNGRSDAYPANPNGSVAGIAGLCDETGRVFGLMPHPDRNFDRMHHPAWTACQSPKVADGMSIFTNAVQHWS